MVVATHNPSNLNMSTIEIKVPHGHWEVSVFNSEDASAAEWINATASVICNE